jgi:N-acetylmuramic acid 6-phosphate etherase
MVNLNVSNEKLRRRALSILMRITGCTREAASAALDACGGQVKAAVLAIKGLSPGAASAALARNGGNLRGALAEVVGSRPPRDTKANAKG